MDLLGEMLLHPAFPAAELRAPKGRGAGRRSPRCGTIPTASAERAFGRADLPGGPRRSGRLTFDEAEEAIRRITRDDLVAFHGHQYGPDRLILVVAGNVTADRVRQAVETRLGPGRETPSRSRRLRSDLSRSRATPGCGS